MLQADADAPDGRGITTPFTLIGAKNSGTTAVFSQFVTWASTAAPADNYALIFGDHGAGWRGFNNYGDGSLNTPGIASALTTLAAGANPVRFDLIGFDECLMADAQAEAAVAGNTQVLVGSEELEGGNGWNFQTAFSALNVADPGSVTAGQIGAGIVNSFATSYVNGKTDGTKRTDTLSAVQTSAKGTSIPSSMPSPLPFLIRLPRRPTGTRWPGPKSGALVRRRSGEEAKQIWGSS